MKRIRQAIEQNPAWSMIVLSFAGLAFPYGEVIPDETVIAMLAVLIFLSCFKITQPLQSVVTWRPFAFCAVRFVLAPMALWALFSKISPDYALGFLVLALVPAGASSAAITGMYRGNVAVALGITIISSVISVFSIPLIVDFLGGQTVAVSAAALLKTLVLCVLVPGCVYWFVRKRERLINFNQAYGRFIVVVLISLLAFVGLTKKRAFFIDHPLDMLYPFLIAIVFFVIAIAMGFIAKFVREERIAYGICSSFNNTSLGAGLAVLYFDDHTTAVTLAALFVWSFLPMLVEPILKRLPK